MDMDISMDIHGKSVDMDMDMDMDGKFHIHGKPGKLRDDMIDVFKIVNDICDGKVAPALHYNNTSVTRGNKFKLHNLTFTHNFR